MCESEQNVQYWDETRERERKKCTVASFDGTRHESCLWPTLVVADCQCLMMGEDATLRPQVLVNGGPGLQACLLVT